MTGRSQGDVGRTRLASGENAAPHDRFVNASVILQAAATSASPALLLRPWRMEDVAALAEVSRDPALRQWASSAMDNLAGDRPQVGATVAGRGRPGAVRPLEPTAHDPAPLSAHRPCRSRPHGHRPGPARRRRRRWPSVDRGRAVEPWPRPAVRARSGGADAADVAMRASDTLARARTVPVLQAAAMCGSLHLVAVVAEAPSRRAWQARYRLTTHVLPLARQTGEGNTKWTVLGPTNASAGGTGRSPSVPRSPGSRAVRSARTDRVRRVCCRARACVSSRRSRCSTNASRRSMFSSLCSGRTMLIARVRKSPPSGQSGVRAFSRAGCGRRPCGWRFPGPDSAPRLWPNPS